MADRCLPLRADMDEDIYLAKSPLPDGRTVSNQEHLSAVAELARHFGEPCGLSEQAFICGILHDFGKYGERFRGVLRGTQQGVDHAFSSAAFLFANERNHPQTYGPLIEAVAAHHDGLHSCASLGNLFNESLQSGQPITSPCGKTASLAGREYQTAFSAFSRDFPGYRLPVLPQRTAENGVEDMLDARMLFSCLVDADYSVSASDRDPDYLKKASGAALDPARLLEKLSDYHRQLQTDSTADKTLNAIRDSVFDECGRAARAPVGLFTLTAPTGVGKTMALLHFALRHCAENDLHRIIIVLPFLTLAEQSEKEYAKIVPDILVDHSQKDLPEEARELAARWDAPMVITTSVRFFESLFADKPTDCRKLHAIAGSVVVFDEAQSLPAKLAPATVQAANRLCRRYNCSMVFSTATQPDLGALPDAVWEPREIVQDNAALYDRLRRVNTDWRLSEKTPLSQIAAEMSGQKSVCAIVNLRRHALGLYELLEEVGAENEALFLTTDLCPAHRLAVVEEIHERIDQKRPCRVVATQCIEAGVDLDFAAMYRALAPLEAVVQAAGRCNRNGKCPGGGRLVVFEPDETGRAYPDSWYEHAAFIVKNMLSDRDGALDINDPAVISEYYGRLLRGAKEKSELRKAIDEKDYPGARAAYRLIENQGVKVIVPWDGERELFESVRQEALQTGVTAALLHRAAPITVTTFNIEAVKKHAENLKFPRRRGSEVIDSDVYILNKGHENCYDAKLGLQFREPEPAGWQC